MCKAPCDMASILRVFDLGSRNRPAARSKQYTMEVQSVPWIYACTYIFIHT